MTAKLTPVRFTAQSASSVLAHEGAMADRYLTMAAYATDPAEVDALIRIAESHERIAARAAKALERF